MVIPPPPRKPRPPLPVRTETVTAGKTDPAVRARRTREALWLLRQRAINRTLHRLAAEPQPRAFPARDGYEVVHLDPCRPGPDGRPCRWRVTHLDAEGWPTGHATARDYRDALTLARTYGGDLARPIGLAEIAIEIPRATL